MKDLHTLQSSTLGGRAQWQGYHTQCLTEMKTAPQKYWTPSKKDLQPLHRDEISADNPYGMMSLTIHRIMWNWVISITVHECYFSLLSIVYILNFWCLHNNTTIYIYIKATLILFILWRGLSEKKMKQLIYVINKGQSCSLSCPPPRRATAPGWGWIAPAQHPLSETHWSGHGGKSHTSCEKYIVAEYLLTLQRCV